MAAITGPPAMVDSAPTMVDSASPRSNKGRSNGAFYMYLGLPQAYQSSALTQSSPPRSKSVMGTVDAPYSKSYAAGLPNRYQNPPMVAYGNRQLSPERMPRRWAADQPPIQTDLREDLEDDVVIGGSGNAETLLQSSASFGKLRKLKDMLGMELITQDDYERSKGAILDEIASPSSKVPVNEFISPKKQELMAVFDDEPIQSSHPPELVVSPSKQPPLPGISDHKSPSRSPSKNTASRRLGKDSDIPPMRGVTVSRAITMIQDKIQQKLEGGPAGLRRAFQFFDADGSGAISHEEFKDAIRLKFMVVFEDHVFDGVMQMFDPGGSGEIDYNTFCQKVMQSKVRDSTSFGSNSNQDTPGAAAIAPKVLQRMIRESAKDLRTAFGHLDVEESGAISVEDLRYALGRYNIEMSDRQFHALMGKIDANSDGYVSYQEFLNYFRKTEISDAQANAVGTVSGMPVSKAIMLIRDKIQQRLEGGPAGLRRAFQFFDQNGSGNISHEEFKHALRLKTMLVFDDKLIGAILGKFDPTGKGALDFEMFCNMVMGSNSRDSTSFTGVDTSSYFERANWEQILRGRVIDHAKALKSTFQHLDARGNGWITHDQLKHTLFRFDIPIGDREFEELMPNITNAESQGQMQDDQVNYVDFLDYFKRSEIQRTQQGMMAVISGIPVPQAVTLIRDKIQQKLEGGPAGLRRAYQYFDEDGSGSISMEEFAKALRMKCMLVFDKALLAKVFASFDPDETGEINYQSFCELVMGSKSRDSTSFSNGLAAGADKVHHGDMDPRNVEKVVRRKVLESWKELKHLFAHLDQGEGDISYEDLRYALERYDIVLTDKQFATLMTKIDLDGDGRISVAEFLGFVRERDVQEFRENAISTISGISIDKAITLIRDKIQQKLEGGPAGLRRAFQYFDTDGSGGIDLGEFREALRMRTMLVFQEALLVDIFNTFDSDSSGVINYRKFCEMVMGSGARDGTSFGGLSAGATGGQGDYGSLEGEALIEAMQRKVHESRKEIWNALKSIDRQATGTVPEAELRYVLVRNNIVVSDLQWTRLLAALDAPVDENGIAEVNFMEFLAMFPPYH